MHLRYSMLTAGIDCNENRHAQVVMRELGINYQHASPQSLGDQWWFWNCTEVPASLPKYLTALDLDPHEAIGYGLSKDLADKIAAGAVGHNAQAEREPGFSGESAPAPCWAKPERDS